MNPKKNCLNGRSTAIPSKKKIIYADHNLDIYSNQKAPRNRMVRKLVDHKTFNRLRTLHK
jgi:hypothetical protein